MGIAQCLKEVYNFEEEKWCEDREAGIWHWKLTKDMDGLSGCKGSLEYHPFSGNLYIWSGQGMCSVTSDTNERNEIEDAEGDYAFRVFTICKEQLVNILRGLGVPEK